MIPSSPNFSSYSNNKTSITNNKNRVLKTIYHHPFYSSSPIINIENTTTTTTNIINIEKSLEHTPKTKSNPFKFQKSNNSNIELSSSPGSGYSINNENDASPLNRYKSTSSYKHFNHCKLKLQSSPYHHHVSGSKQQSHQQQDDQSSPYLNCSQSSQSSPSSLLIFNLKHQLTTNSNNTSEDNSESNNNLSTLSIKTNPPTTPISSSVNDSSESSPSQFKIPTKPAPSSEPHYVTPASSTTNVSSATSSKILSVLNSNGTSSTHTTYSRSSSLTSLGSFDIKSTHSSVQSEYSSDSHNKNGYETPSGYSDLPDSPGEQFNYNYYINNLNHFYQMNAKFSNFKPTQLPFHEETSILTVDSNPKSNDITVIERTVLNNNNNMASYMNQQHNDSTCSTDSKQRNVKTSQNSTLTLNDSCRKIPANNTSKSNGSSAYNSQSNSFLFPSTCFDTTKNIVQNNEAECDDDEDLVTYDQEGSIINEDARSTISSKSNVSSLSFPNEPSADLEFIRKILASRKSSLNNTQTSINTIVSTQQQQPKLPQIQKQPWSVVPSFTPPVKLNNNLENYKNPIIIQPLINQQVNRSLFDTKQENKTSDNYDYDDTDYFLKYSNLKKNEEIDETEDDQDDDRPMSIASVPSEIRLDISNSNCFDKHNFNKLFSKLNTTVSQNLINKDNLRNNDHSIFNNFDTKSNNNLIEDNVQDISFNNESMCSKQQNSIHENTYIVEEKYNEQEEDEDDDQKILNEFINEVLPIAMAANNTSYNDEQEEEDEIENKEENEEENYLNGSDNLKYELENYDNSQYCLVNNRCETNNECIRTLPKIEEVDEEDVEEETIKQSKKQTKQEYLKRLSFSKTISTSSIGTTANNHISHCPSKYPVIQMTKTARLRQQNMEQSKAKNNIINTNKSKLTTSIPTKRQATTNLNENKKLSCTVPLNNLSKQTNNSYSTLNNTQKKTLAVSCTKNHSNGFHFNLRK